MWEGVDKGVPDPLLRTILDKNYCVLFTSNSDSRVTKTLNPSSCVQGFGKILRL